MTRTCPPVPFSSHRSNIQNVLKNKIQSGLLSAQNNQEDTTMVVEERKSETKTETHTTPIYSTTAHSIPLSMVKTGMEVETPSQPFAYSPSELTSVSMLKLVFQCEDALVIEAIPSTATCKQVRQYVVQQALFPSIQSVLGWRLFFSNALLDDNKLISEYNLPQGALLQICFVEGDAMSEEQNKPYINAATYPAVYDKNGIRKTLIRVIEHSKTIPKASEPLVLPVETQHVEETTVSSKPAEFVEDYFPILRREGYYMVPSHFDMRHMTKEDLQHVKAFTVGREGAGEICWDGETDVTFLNLDERVVIERDLTGTPFVTVYPQELYMNVLPPVGCELNKPAVVRLFNMYPRTSRSEAGLKRYEAKLRKMIEAMGAEWIGYDGSTGILELRVAHFSRVCNRGVFWIPLFVATWRYFRTGFFLRSSHCNCFFNRRDRRRSRWFHRADNAANSEQNGIRAHPFLPGCFVRGVLESAVRNPFVFDGQRSESTRRNEYEQGVDVELRRIRPVCV